MKKTRRKIEAGLKARIALEALREQSTAAAGYNFALLLRWLARLLRAMFQALSASIPIVRLA